MFKRAAFLETPEYLETIKEIIIEEASVSGRDAIFVEGDIEKAPRNEIRDAVVFGISSIYGEFGNQAFGNMEIGDLFDLAEELTDEIIARLNDRVRS